MSLQQNWPQVIPHDQRSPGTYKCLVGGNLKPWLKLCPALLTRDPDDSIGAASKDSRSWLSRGMLTRRGSSGFHALVCLAAPAASATKAMYTAVAETIVLDRTLLARRPAIYVYLYSRQLGLPQPVLSALDCMQYAAIGSLHIDKFTKCYSVYLVRVPAPQIPSLITRLLPCI